MMLTITGVLSAHSASLMAVMRLSGPNLEGEKVTQLYVETCKHALFLA
jgi:hypothetical protein